jgi:hypothetical protein
MNIVNAIVAGIVTAISASSVTLAQVTTPRIVYPPGSARAKFQECIKYWHEEINMPNGKNHVWKYTNKCSILFSIERTCPDEEAARTALIPTEQREGDAFANCVKSGDIVVNVLNLRAFP